MRVCSRCGAGLRSFSLPLSGTVSCSCGSAITLASQVLAVDALAPLGAGWLGYVFPPINLIMKTLLEVRNKEVEDVF